MREAIHVDHLTKRYRLGSLRHETMLREVLTNAFRRGRNKSSQQTILALDDVNFKVDVGEVVGIIGRNGAGKTTALRILCGLLQPDTGRVEIAGHDVGKAPLEARRNLGYVPDGAPLYSNLTPFEHLSLVGRLHGVAPRELASEANRLLEGLALQDRKDEPIGGFSRGMRQKVAIACALLPRPSLLVLDEPSAALDARAEADLFASLRELYRGRTVLLISHRFSTVRCADWIYVLDGGRIVEQGSHDQLVAAGGTYASLFAAQADAFR